MHNCNDGRQIIIDIYFRIYRRKPSPDPDLEESGKNSLKEVMSKP